MEKHAEALQLLGDLLADLADPNFVWQLLALLASLVLAWMFARGWQARSGAGSSRFGEAGARLVFPFAGMAFSGLAILLLKPFLHVNLLRVSLPLFASMALVRAVVFVLRQAFPQAVWLAAWERIIAASVWGWLALYITDLAPYVAETLAQVQFSIGQQTLDLWMLLHGVVTLFLTVVLALWVAGAIEKRLMGMDSLDGNLRIVGVRVTKAVLTVVAILAGLSLVGIDMTALSVFTGALGVGLGFGLQKIASNYVSGFILLLERSIRIGNIVQVGNDAGEVTQITTRYTVLKHPGGTEYIVPNETLIGSVVHNQTYSDSRLRLTTSVGVAYSTDLDRAMAAMIAVAASQPRVLASPAPGVQLIRFGDSSLELELGFWISDPVAGKGNIVSDINLGIWRAFREQGIDIPFPQREVRLIAQSDSPATSA